MQPRFTLFLQLKHQHPEHFEQDYPNLAKSPFRLTLRQFHTNKDVLEWDERDFRVWVNDSFEEDKIEEKPDYQPFDPEMVEGIAVVVYDRRKGENGESRGEMFTSDDFTIPDRYLA